MALALLPRLEGDERGGEVRARARAGEREAADHEHPADLGLLPGDRLDLLDHLLGLVERHALGALDRDDHVALVLVGDEAGRDHAEHQVGRAEEGEEHAEDDERALQEPVQQRRVAAPRPVEQLVDLPEEHPLLALVRREQQRRERRGEGERAEGRERDRGGDGERELPVDRAGGAGEERDRDEHRDEHDRDRDHRARDLLHALPRRLERRELPLVHQPLDVLDHHDRVVDDEAGGEREAEQRERVDREAEQLHERERADERDGERERGDEHAPPAVEEEEDDEDHERDRLGERHHHLVHRRADRERGVGADARTRARAGTASRAAPSPSRTPSRTSSAFAVGSWKMPRPTPVRPLKRSSWP